MNKRTCKPITLVIGTCLAGSLTGYAVADPQANPFSLSPLSSGYMIGQANEQKIAQEGKCGEGKCGGKAPAEAVCGIYKVGSSHLDDTKVKDGVCGGHGPVEMLCGELR